MRVKENTPFFNPLCFRSGVGGSLFLQLSLFSSYYTH